MGPRRCAGQRLHVLHRAGTDALVAAQDFTDIQLVIVDDCSQRDDSLAVAEPWMQKHRPRFPSGLLVRHEANRGLAEARNTAFEIAAGNTVFVMDADNVIYPSCIRKLRRALVAADAAYSQLVMFGDITGVGHADYWSQALLSRGAYIDAMALVHKRAWKQPGGYTHIEGGWEDYDFWCKLAEQEARCCYPGIAWQVSRPLGLDVAHGLSPKLRAAF